VKSDRALLSELVSFTATLDMNLDVSQLSLYYPTMLICLLSLFVSAGLAYKPWAESTAGWFGVREKHYWLADKSRLISQIQAAEQAAYCQPDFIAILD